MLETAKRWRRRPLHSWPLAGAGVRVPWACSASALVVWSLCALRRAARPLPVTRHAARTSSTHMAFNRDPPRVSNIFRDPSRASKTIQRLPERLPERLPSAFQRIPNSFQNLPKPATGFEGPLGAVRTFTKDFQKASNIVQRLPNSSSGVQELEPASRNLTEASTCVPGPSNGVPRPFRSA